MGQDAAVRFLLLATGPQGLGKRGGKLRHRLAVFLSGELRAHFEVVALEGYAELLRAVGTGTVSIAWLPPAVFVEAHERYGVALLGRTRRHGTASYRGAIYVRSESGRSSVEELRGARMGWVDPVSCAGYLFPRLALAERGLDADGFFAEESFLGSHAAVARAVEAGEVDAGASYVHVLGDDAEALVESGWGRVVGLDSMRALLVTPQVPNDTICASPSVDRELAHQVAELLRGLHQTPDGQAILQGLFQAVAIEAAQADEYAVVRRALEKAGTKPPA
jgi:phosphonate transport system substrate-binding protein